MASTTPGRSALRRNDGCLKLDEFGLGKLAWTEDRNPGQRTADHGHFVAGIKPWTALAILVDLVRQGGAVRDTEAEVKEEVGMRVKRHTATTP